MQLGMMLEVDKTFTTMSFKVIRGQGQGQEMTSVSCRDYFSIHCCSWFCSEICPD